MREILSFKNLTIGYGKKKRGRTVCKLLSGSVVCGELVCLLGVNGMGKSTLLKTLCRFIKPLSGNVLINNKQIYSYSELELSKIISVVLTETFSVVNATVEEFVGYGRSPYTGLLGKLSDNDILIVNQAMIKCGIFHKAKSLLSTLSDGELQKASIAKALAQDTPIIILDEPTAFLDLTSRIEIIKLLRELSVSYNKAIIMSTHDLDLAIQMADKFWLLHSNSLVVGSPEDLLYKNKFQDFFTDNNVDFDIQTGMFRVGYEFFYEVPVDGAGFELLLLQRAFARVGVKVIKYNFNSGVWIKVNKKLNVFELVIDDSSVISSDSIELIVKKSFECLVSNKLLNVSYELN